MQLLPTFASKPIARKTTLLAALLLLTATQAASAQTAACAPRDAVVQKLAQDYGESRQSIGLGRDNAVMEVFASLSSGSWTITVTRANGMTCLVASGQAFEAIEEGLPETDSAL
jgi:hypothetical protein